MTPEREHDLERWDEAENRADQLTEERDCAREALQEAEQTIVTLKAENQRLSTLLQEIAEMASAMQVTVRAIQEAWVPASKTEPPRP